MRKQYHLRDSPAGLLAWDVDRLINLSAHLPERDVPLTDIRELDEVHWFDGQHSLPTCRAITEHARMINECDLAYPIILSADGRVMDGMHRVAKAFLQGLPAIKAVQFTEHLDPDFIGVEEKDLPY
jgi:hypothetical protein